MRGTSGQSDNPTKSRVERRGTDRILYGYEGTSDARYDSLNTSRELREYRWEGILVLELNIGIMPPSSRARTIAA